MILKRHVDSDNGVMYTLEVAFISGDGVGSSFTLHVQGFVNITITVRSPGFQISPAQTYLSRNWADIEVDSTIRA